jgi:hypothetical protein
LEHNKKLGLKSQKKPHESLTRSIAQAGCATTIRAIKEVVR